MTPALQDTKVERGAESTPPSATTTSAAGGTLGERLASREVRLLAKRVHTTTCPHCARRSGEVSAVVRTAGRLRNPSRFAAVAVLSSLAVISLIASFPLLLLLMWHQERALPLEVRLCRECEERLRRAEQLTRIAYCVAGALPLVTFIAVAVVADVYALRLQILPFAALELTVLVAAVVAVVVIRRLRRRTLPFVSDFDGSAWRIELPAAWDAVLSTEAAALLDDNGAAVP